MSIRRLVLCAGVLMLCQAWPDAQTPAAETWAALDAEASDWYANGNLPRAIEAANEALQKAASPRETGRSLDRLGFFYYTSGKLEEGERYLRQSLQARESAFGVDSPEYAETANDLAMLLRDLRHMDEAQLLARRAVATRERVLGAESLPLAESLNTLATVYALGGDYSTAVSTFERAVKIHESRPVAERSTEEYGTLSVNLAGTYQRLGKYDAAETTFQRGLDALKVRPGIDHPAYAASLLAYAALEVELGRYVEAERLYDEGGRLVQRELGEEHPVYATFLNNRGFLYQSIGNGAAAAASYRQALDLKRKLYGPGSLLAVSTLRNLAHLTYTQDPRAGERLLAEAVDAYAKMASAPPFDYTSVLVGLARAERERGDLVDARTTATKALDVSRAGLGEHHPLFAAAARELGLTLAAAGDNVGAEDRLREALAIAEESHGSRHPDLAVFLDALAGFYVGQRNYAAAQALYARSLAIDTAYWTDVLEIGSERFKALSLENAIDPVPTLIAFQEQAGAELPEARALAFEAVTRRKGRIIGQVRSWRQRLELSSSDQIDRSVKQWQAMLECRTALTVALGYRDLKPHVAGLCSLTGTDLEGRYERLLSDVRSRWTADLGTRARRAIADLQERADALEASLNREVADLRVDITALHASVADLRASLADDEALIELVSYGAAAPGRHADSRKYGAFVLDKRTLQWADLGPAAPIDTAVGDLLEAAQDWSTSIVNHERAAERESVRTAQHALDTLSRLVWRPIAPSVAASARIRRLRIAPDGALNLVPFEALSDGHDVIDRYSVSYMPAGRDLLDAPAAVSASPPVVIVSPGGSGGPHSDTVASGRADGFAMLAGAAAEAADARALLPGTRVFTGTGATEQHVKRLQAPALLLIVGHGVVRGAADCHASPCASPALDSTTQAMSLAAIVLEEAYGRGATSADDGLLTALELENMNLRGTEMLVLSQCRMASGLPSVGEGVYGMRRAAAIAGARTFVAPLWNVDDHVQRRLMRRFYERLAAGERRSDALRSAKLRLRQSPETNSFLYWAPVILSGSPDRLPDAVVRH